MRVTTGGKLLLLVLALLCAGCAHYYDNQKLAAPQQTGYRFGNVRPPPSQQKPFVVLGFSGGGTRAAAFSFGLMEELAKTDYTAADGSRHRLIDDVEIISSVSGGSFTAAYYALFPERFFHDFPDRFLYRNIERGLFFRLFSPVNWVRLASPDFSRIDMAQEYYDSTIFEGKTFADLLARPKGSAPFLVLNATDIGIAHRFEFTQDQFDLLCSDLAGFPVARAVAASSNFPVAFAPLTVNIFQDPKVCQLPLWVGPAQEPDNPKRRAAEAKAAESYHEADRRYAYLLDGGLSDNLGLRGPYLALTSTYSPWSLVRYENQRSIGPLLVISANAKTSKKRSWDGKSSPPGIGAVLDVVTSGPMDDVSSDSIEMIDGHFQQMQQLSADIDACNQRLANCPGGQQINNPFAPIDFTFAELTFDDLPDPRLRKCLQELPTSFALPRETVELLRVAGRYLLLHSKAFVAAMKRIDSTWEPGQIVFDEGKVREVCGGRE